MEQLSSIKIKLFFSEYSELVEKFSNLVKENGFKPLYYKDYRKIAGKLCKKNPEEVIIEFINYESFKIIFRPGNTVIYSGSLFDLSFGTFIKDYFRKELKEMSEKNNAYNEKNNTYDIWGDAVKCNESAVSAGNITTSTSNAISSNMSNKSDYSNVFSVDNDIATSYRSLTQDYYGGLEKKITKLEKEKSRVKAELDDICSKLDLDDIYSKLDELLKEIAEEQRFSKYKCDGVDFEFKSLLSKINELEEKINTKEDKKCDKRKDNEKTMNANKMFNFDFGFVDSNIRMSPYGMAIRNADGRYVSYDVKTGSVIDVEPFNFEGNRFMMKMPVAVKDVAVGDIVIHNHKPMFVVNTNDKVTVIDIYNGEEKNILLTRSMFGFDFVTKVVSFINFSNASAENPFGNMWPLFMLSDNNSGFGLNGANPEDSRTTMLMLMAMMGQSGMPANMFQNPMFMMALMNDGGSNMQDLMMVMAMSSVMNNNNSTDFKIPASPAVVPPNNQ